MIRRLLPWIAAAAVALSAVLFFVWLLLARQVEEQVFAWADMRRAEGYAVAWQRFDLGGFPFRFELVLAEPRIAKDGWSAAAPQIRVAFAPWRPDRADLTAPRLALAGPDGEATLEAVTAALMIEGGRATSLAIEGVAATGRFGAEDLGRADRARLVIDRFAPGTTDWQAESLAGKVTLWGTRPAARFTPQLLFTEPFDLDLAGTVKGPINDIVRWRDAGGTLDLTRVVLDWGPLKLDGDATLALDGEMRPLGAGTAKLRGWEPTLERLVARGQVKAQDGAVAKIVLGLMARPTADGSELTVPLTAQNGRLLVGPVPVLTLPRLVVPARP